jgi:hypothetical protein
MKKRWVILTQPLHFTMSVQAHIPPALAALHNFIVGHDSTDVNKYLYDENGNLDCHDKQPGIRRAEEIDFGRLAATEIISRAEKRQAEAYRDQMAQAMWDDYQRVLTERRDNDMEIDNDIHMEPLN